VWKNKEKGQYRHICTDNIALPHTQGQKHTSTNTTDCYLSRTLQLTVK